MERRWSLLDISPQDLYWDPRYKRYFFAGTLPPLPGDAQTSDASDASIESTVQLAPTNRSRKPSILVTDDRLPAVRDKRRRLWRLPRHISWRPFARDGGRGVAQGRPFSQEEAVSQRRLSKGEGASEDRDLFEQPACIRRGTVCILVSPRPARDDVALRRLREQASSKARGPDNGRCRGQALRIHAIFGEPLEREHATDAARFVGGRGRLVDGEHDCTLGRLELEHHVHGHQC
ncbi:hypothetical protein V5799_026233 [Amblyomma americanum]|uniref:Uncharacterized protein n=1 Tax=Amblyomma americanum TaxID=6943 RepID=A0AAQ4DJ62_AMBAM